MDNALKNQISTIFNSQQEFFASHKTRDVAFRKNALQQLKKTILDHKEDIYKALDADLGKSKIEADEYEIDVSIAEIDYAFNHIDEWVKDEKPPVDKILQPSELVVSREPFGVSYIIGPFNYPIDLTFAPLVGAIVSGCTAIVKPSENTPETAAVIEKIIKSAFEPNYIAVVQGALEENTYLLSLPFNFIFFTGSPTVGKIVMKAAAEHLTPIMLELGGKCPTIILPDADLDQVVKTIAVGKFANSGQTCVAPDYILAHKSIKDKLVEKLTAHLQQNFMELGKIGKIISTKQVERIIGYLKNTKGKILIGGKCDVEKRHVQPVIVDNVTWDDTLMQQELFAPILPILTFEDIDTVDQLVNKHHGKPLAAYVYTKDYALGRHILNKIPSGDSQINGVFNHVASNVLPFGGVGASGMGEYHGKYSYYAFTHRKSLRISK